MNCLFLLSLLLPSIIGAEQLLTFHSQDDSRNIPACLESHVLTCNRVSVNVNALLNSENIELPTGLVLTATRTAQGGDKDTLALTFENKEEFVQGVFVYGNHMGKTFVSGSVHLAKAGRHFKLEMCSSAGGNDDCYTWSETDTNKWKNEASIPSQGGVDRVLTAKQEADLAAGRADTTTYVKVSITVYISQSFRDSFNNDATAIKAFISTAISETNQGYYNSRVPIVMVLKCIIESDIKDNQESSTMLNDFEAAADGDYYTYRRSADVAVVLTNFENMDACGIAYTDILEIGQTLSVVKKSCAVGYYSFGHEIAHMVGALHNPESGSVNKKYPQGYGFLMRPPINSGFRTIMAYPAAGYPKRLNVYSNPSVKYGSIPAGDANSNNAGLLTERRFIMSNVGDESMDC